MLSGNDLSRILTEAVRGLSSGSGLTVLEDWLDRGLADEAARRADSTTKFTREDLEGIQRQLVWAEVFDPQREMVPTFALRPLRRVGAEARGQGADWSAPYVPVALADAPDLSDITAVRTWAERAWSRTRPALANCSRRGTRY